MHILKPAELHSPWVACRQFLATTGMEHWRVQGVWGPHVERGVRSSEPISYITGVPGAVPLGLCPWSVSQVKGPNVFLHYQL